MLNKQLNLWTTSLLLSTTWLLPGPQVQAANCKAPGNLVFLGKTSDLSRSVWLSGTGSGSFALEAPSNDVVDTWGRSKRGLHVSLSPVVSQGSGLPHTLIDVTGDPCEIDMENQKGGIVFPPIFHLPPKLPPILKPPSGRPSLPGLMPGLPIAVTPPIGSLPPSGLTPSRPGMPTLPGAAAPPIATLPPSGVMPSVPGGVTPPIGSLPPSGLTPSRPGMPTLPGAAAPPIATLPPSGVMPTVPGGVTPPIGSLPPSGLTPSRPGMPTLPGAAAPPIATLPPSGVMPTVPGGVTPPIGSLPPSGLTPSRPGMPTLPGAAAPPIATLPPSGVKPTVPGGVTPPIGSLPPSGLTPSRPGMPTLPGAAAPPIATLPPSGVMPSLPGGVTPPIGTLPPSGGITPELPIGVQPPIATLPPNGVTPEPPIGITPGLPSIDGSEITGELGPDGLVALTPARKFSQEPLWNVWVDSRFTDVSDRRSGLDLDGNSGYVTIGADRRMSADLAIGLMTIFERTRSKGFGGDWKIRSDGISFGPYAAYRLTPEWSVDASFSVGQLDNDNFLAVLRERYDTQRYALGLNATGQYLVDEVIFTPKLSLNYSHFRNEEHDMKGSVAGTPIRLGIESENFDYGVAEASLQLSKGYRTDGGKVWYPYTEVAVSNEFERPNDGRIVTGDLSQEKTSPWSGSLRTGVQGLMAEDVYVDTSIGYLSFGQNGLDIWEGRVMLSIAF